MENSSKLRHDASALSHAATNVREAIQHSSAEIERVASLADYFAAITREEDARENFTKDAELLRKADPETLDRWALWLRTIAENAEKEAV